MGAKPRAVASAVAVEVRLQALRDAKDAIDRDYGEPIALEQLASRAHYSKYHFAREFAASYGETPVAYLTQRRIERAKDLLRSANLAITEVAAIVGFSSVGAFSTRFRRLVGMSPREYRRRHLGGGAPLLIPGCALMMWTRPLGSPQS